MFGLRSLPEERRERLAYQDPCRKGAVLTALEAKHYSDCTFKPQINARSRRIGKPNPLEELVQNRRRDQKLAEAAREVEDRLRQQCTFQPDTSKRAIRNADYQPVADGRFHVHGQDPSKLGRAVRMYQRERQQQLEQKRCAREVQDLRECTFSPLIRAAPPATSAKPVVVRGLERHLELQRMAERQRMELQSRMNKAFLSNPQAPRTSVTVQQPFKLSANAPLAQEKRQRIAAEVAAQTMQECTFRPKTNVSANRQLIERILQADDTAHLAPAPAATP